MRRVIVIGCPGSGKSCFSRALHAKTGLPLHHLDQMNWNSDRTTVPKAIFMDRLRTALAQDAWIIDGNYNSSLEMRIQACDTIFFLDLPPDACLAGIAARRNKPRPDMPWVETEEDAEFTVFVQSFNTNVRPQLLHLLEKYADGRKIATFCSHAEADAYLSMLQQASQT